MKYALILASAILLIFSTPAHANDNLLSLGVGYYDANDNEEAVDFRAEYRWNESLFWLIKPWVGVEASSDGAVYGVGGVLLDAFLTDQWYIAPSFGAGLYHDGDGKDLGHAIEFRSQFETGWQFKNNHRIGVAGGHISNAGIGDSNPGTEIINLYWHVPVGF